MNDGQAGVTRAADDRPERAGGPGGWWQADDGFWYPPAGQANGHHAGAPGSAMMGDRDAAPRPAAVPPGPANGYNAGAPGAGIVGDRYGGPGPAAIPARQANGYDAGGPAAIPAGPAGPAGPDDGRDAGGSTMAALQAAADRWAATPDPAATGGAGPSAATPTEPGGGGWAAEPGGGAWGAGRAPDGGGDPVTGPVTMAENGWGGEGMSSPPLYAPAQAPRVAGMAETFRSWPLWARIGVPMAAAFFALVLVSGGLAAVAGEPEESDGTETVATQPPTTAERTTTTRPPTTTTAAPTTTTAPPTTTTTAPPPTTAPPAPAAPLPPPTTAAPPATVAPAPAEPACHPSYSGCVPMASDVDCAGGSGDGPAYTGTVTVIGPDEYDLDSDNDGVACEP